MLFKDSKTQVVHDICIVDSETKVDITADFFGVGLADDYGFVYNEDEDCYEAYIEGNLDIDQMITRALDWKYSRVDFYGQNGSTPDEKEVWLDGEEQFESDLDESELESIASAMYDGGWRFNDDQYEMAKEYQIDGNNLSRICDLLRDYEDADIEKNQRYYLSKGVVEVTDYEWYPGCATEHDAGITRLKEVVGQAGRDELEQYKCFKQKFGNYIRVTEYFLEEICEDRNGCEYCGGTILADYE